MAAITRIRQIGNSDGLSLRAEQLREAGLGRGDEVVVEARPGRIVIAKVDSPYARSIDALEACMARYDGTLRRLAK
jgi:putative addiction module antidote